MVFCVCLCVLLCVCVCGGGGGGSGPGEASTSGSVLALLESLQNAPHLEVHKDIITWILKVALMIQMITQLTAVQTCEMICSERVVNTRRVFCRSVCR